MGFRVFLADLEYWVRWQLSVVGHEMRYVLFFLALLMSGSSCVAQTAEETVAYILFGIEDGTRDIRIPELRSRILSTSPAKYEMKALLPEYSADEMRLIYKTSDTGKNVLASIYYSVTQTKECVFEVDRIESYSVSEGGRSSQETCCN